MLVALLVGAWIETLAVDEFLFGDMKSHSLWVRGLKHHLCREQAEACGSHSLWVRGLKLDTNKNEEWL